MIGEQLSKRGVISPTFASCESRVSIVFGALLSGCKAGPGGTGREPLYTHYGFAGMTAHVSATTTRVPHPFYFAPGNVSQNLWWLVGFVVSVVNVAIWGWIDPMWWSAIGLWQAARRILIE